MNSKILVSIVIVALIGVAAAGYQVSTQSTGFWSPTQSQNPGTDSQSDSSSVSGSDSQSSSSGLTTSSGQSQSGSGGVNVKISSSQAKSIAQNSIAQEGAAAGTPKLTTLDGKKVYVVPVIYNGKQAGEFVIDAETGKIIEGAGGAP